MRILKSIIYPYLLNVFSFLGLYFIPPFMVWYLEVSDSGFKVIEYFFIVIFFILTYLSGRIIAQNNQTYYLSVCIGVYLLAWTTCLFMLYVVLFFYFYWLYLPWFLSILAGCFITRHQINIKRKKLSL